MSDGDISAHFTLADVLVPIVRSPGGSLANDTPGSVLNANAGTNGRGSLGVIADPIIGTIPNATAGTVT